MNEKLQNEFAIIKCKTSSLFDCSDKEIDTTFIIDYLKSIYKNKNKEVDYDFN